MNPIKDFFSSIIESFVWLITVCLSGIYIMGTLVLTGLFTLGALALPLLPLIVGIWLVSLLF